MEILVDLEQSLRDVRDMAKAIALICEPTRQGEEFQVLGALAMLCWEKLQLAETDRSTALKKLCDTRATGAVTA